MGASSAEKSSLDIEMNLGRLEEKNHGQTMLKLLAENVLVRSINGYQFNIIRKVSSKFTFEQSYHRLSFLTRSGKLFPRVKR